MTFWPNIAFFHMRDAIQLEEVLRASAQFTCRQAAARSLCFVTLQWMRGRNTAMPWRLLLTSTCNYVTKVTLGARKRNRHSFVAEISPLVLAIGAQHNSLHREHNY